MFRRYVPWVVISLMLPFVVMGCGESESRFQQYEKTVIEAQERAEGLRARANLKALETAIQQYYVEWGRYPASLNNLSLIQNRGIDPDLYAYDPASGRIQLR